jgi:hypothetical protein
MRYLSLFVVLLITYFSWRVILPATVREDVKGFASKHIIAVTAILVVALAVVVLAFYLPTPQLLPQ